MDPTTAVLIYALCDLAMCIIFLAGYLWLKPGEDQEERQVNKTTITADHFTVYLPKVPPQTTEKHLREYFAALTASPCAEAAKIGLFHLFDVAEVHLVEDNAATVGAFMKRGKVLMEAERILQKMRFLSFRMEQGARSGGWCGETYQQQLARLQVKKNALDAQAATIGRNAQLSASTASVAAFVTFERAEARDWVVEQFPPGIAAWLAQPRFMRLLGKRVEVMEAPPPREHHLGEPARVALREGAPHHLHISPHAPRPLRLFYCALVCFMEGGPVSGKRVGEHLHRGDGE